MPATDDRLMGRALAFGRTRWPVALADVLVLAGSAWKPENGALAAVMVAVACVVVPGVVGWRHGRVRGRTGAVAHARATAAVPFVLYVLFLAGAVLVGEPVIDFWMLVFWPVTLAIFGFLFLLLMVPPLLGVLAGTWWRGRTDGGSVLDHVAGELLTRRRP